jgi:hypothetical protein
VQAKKLALAQRRFAKEEKFFSNWKKQRVGAVGKCNSVTTKQDVNF